MILQDKGYNKCWTFHVSFSCYESIFSSHVTSSCLPARLKTAVGYLLWKYLAILFSQNILSISFKQNLNLEIQTHWNGRKCFRESLVFPFRAAAALWHSSLSEEYSSGWHSLTHTAHLKRVDPYGVRLTDSPHIINGLHSHAVLLLFPFPGAVSVVPVPHTPNKMGLIQSPIVRPAQSFFNVFYLFPQELKG